MSLTYDQFITESANVIIEYAEHIEDCPRRVAREIEDRVTEIIKNRMENQ